MIIGIIIITLFSRTAHGTTHARSQGRQSASARLSASPPRAGHRRTLLLERVLRPARLRAMCSVRKECNYDYAAIVKMIPRIHVTTNVFSPSGSYWYMKGMAVPVEFSIQRRPLMHWQWHDNRHNHNYTLSIIGLALLEFVQRWGRWWMGGIVAWC